MSAAIVDLFKVLLSLLADDRLRNAAIVLGVFFAFYSIITARMLAKKKQSADMLFNSKRDPGLQKGYAQIRACHDGADNMRLLATTKRDTDQAIEIRYLLNHFESLSVGIRAGIYDGRMLQESWHSVMTETYTKSLPFIQALRERDNKPTTFQAFEWLCKKWLAKPLQTYPTTYQGKVWYWIRHGLMR